MLLKTKFKQALMLRLPLMLHFCVIAFLLKQCFTRRDFSGIFKNTPYRSLPEKD